MVLETMTYEEIWKEMRKDFFGIIKHKLNEGGKLLRKKVLSTPPSSVVRLSPICFQSKSTGLKHCLCLYSIGKKDF